MSDPNNPYGQNPDEPTNPYGQNQNPYGQPPQEQNPYGQPPQGQNPYGQPPSGAPYGTPAYGAPGYGGPATAPKHPSATTALVLGLVGLIGGCLCGLPYLLSPFAWATGAKTVKAIDSSNGAYSGRDQANIGKILGIIGTVLLALSIIALIAFVAFAIVNGESLSSTLESDLSDSGWESDLDSDF